MSSAFRATTSHIGPGASDVMRYITQAGNILEAMEYSTPDVAFDTIMLVRKLLLNAVETIDNAMLTRLKEEADRVDPVE